MTLGQRVDRDLVPGRVTVDREGASAEVDVVEVDRLGVRVTGVRVTGAEPVGIPTHAARIPDALDVLPDRIVPVEVAPELGGAVLRSRGQDVDDGEYFEVRTNGRTVEVERVHGRDHEVRPFTVTRDQLRRMVDDLADTFAPE